jgi:hypothetical protein
VTADDYAIGCMQQTESAAVLFARQYDDQSQTTADGHTADRLMNLSRGQVPNSNGDVSEGLSGPKVHA